MMLQQTVMEADYDSFKIIPEYLEAMPRSSEIEERSLDQKMIQRGQLDPIKVRRDMGILDGYTRHKLLGARGIKIKYIFMDFATKEEELIYVIECNLIRRQLNTFQKVETTYKMLSRERELRRIRLNTSYVDFIISIKSGNTTATLLVKDMSVGMKYVNRILKAMTDGYYLRRNKVEGSRTKEGYGSAHYVYRVLPKSEEILGKAKDAKRLGALNITDIIGVHSYTIVKAMYLIENGSDELLNKLRESKISVRDAYAEIMGRGGVSKKGIPYNTWGKWDKIQCPSCNYVGRKETYTKI